MNNINEVQGWVKPLQDGIFAALLDLSPLRSGPCLTLATGKQHPVIRIIKKRGRKPLIFLW